MKPLANTVIEYIENEGIEVLDAVALEIADNLTVAAQDPMQPLELSKRLSLNNVDAIVGSACVQMPSLPSIQAIQARTGVPTLSASIATARQMMRALNLDAQIPNLGCLFE